MVLVLNAGALKDHESLNDPDPSFLVTPACAPRKERSMAFPPPESFSSARQANSPALMVKGRKLLLPPLVHSGSGITRNMIVLRQALLSDHCSTGTCGVAGFGLTGA